MTSLKDTLNMVGEEIKCSPPSTLRVYASNARLNAQLHPDQRQFYLDQAAKYDRMAYSRSWLWAEYRRQCLELDE
jgi:hypothetical protein